MNDAAEYSAEILKNFCEFLSEELNSKIEIETEIPRPAEANFGASVKVSGKIPFVIGVLADKSTFHRLAESYEKIDTENIAEDFDAISEMVNVFAGQLIVKIAAKCHVEEDLLPPRFGKISGSFRVKKISADVGNLYLYLGGAEIISAT